MRLRHGGVVGLQFWFILYFIVAWWRVEFVALMNCIKIFANQRIFCGIFFLMLIKLSSLSDRYELVKVGFQVHETAKFVSLISKLGKEAYFDTTLKP